MQPVNPFSFNDNQVKQLPIDFIIAAAALVIAVALIIGLLTML